MTLQTISSGVDTSFGTKLNANFNNAYPRVVASTPYTGTGFDAGRTEGDGTGTTTNNTTLTVAAGAVYDYIRIVMTLYTHHMGSSSANYGQAYIKLETSVASAASWTTRLDQLVAGNGFNGGHSDSGIKTIEFYYAPTAGEKSGGLDIRITGTATIVYGSGSAQATVANRQTMIFAN